LGVTAQFLALIRTLGEMFRIKYFAPDRYTLVAAAIMAFAPGLHRAVVGIAVANMVALFVYKVVFM
jgi:hypothetical protein